jgi:CHASE3 domain sensor protein
VYALVGGLALLLMVAAAVAAAAQWHVIMVDNHLRGTLRPAQTEVATLTKGYIDMETGQRGFLLTRDLRLLQPYTTGEQEVAGVRTRLAQQFAGDPVSTALLTGATTAGERWQRDSAEPEIDAARAGTLAGQALLTSTLDGKTLFDTLRARLADLTNRINQLTTAAVASATGAQTGSSVVIVACALLALVLGGIGVTLVRRSLVAPIDQLLGAVDRVAEGDLDHRVAIAGPAEVAQLARAVEAMRLRIRAELTNAGETAVQIARLEEVDRIARDVGARVTSELFTTSLAVQSTASRFAAARPALAGVTSGIDRALNELRLAMWGQVAATRGQSLGARVIGLVGEVEPMLGAAPELRLHGEVDQVTDAPVVTEVLAVLRDVLPALTGVVRIDLSAAGGRLRLRVNGALPAERDRDVLAGLPERARALLGEATIEIGAGRLRLAWEVPV